jgi:CheY-like chemotaxis protein
LAPEDWSGSETILLVEDDKPVRDLAEAILKRQGYTVIAAQNGPEAVARLEEDHSGAVHMLLTDGVMPKMSGRELYTRLSAHIPDLKVLYMSGYTNNVIVHHGVVDEGVSYIQKPFRYRVWQPR